MNGNFETVPYVDIGDVPFAVWQAELANYPSSPLIPIAPALYAICKGHTALALAHMKRESSFETDRQLLSPGDHNPFNLRPNYINGMLETVPGATGIKHDYLTFEDPIFAAREWRRRVIDDPTYKGGRYRPTMTLREYVNTYAPVGDAHPTTGDANETYAADMVTMLTRFAATEQSLPKEPAMALKPYAVPGLDKPLYLPAHIKTETRLINNSNWGSSQIYTGQTKTTWHDTGPTGSNAEGEWRWANNGREGAGPAGYQAIIDDDQIIITHPFNRVTWHAGTTEGNRSWGAEQCREGVDRAKAITNAAAFHGALCAAKGWQVDTHLVQHHYWYGKNCPSYIRANGLWSNAVKQTTEFAAAATRAAAGGSPGPDPTPIYAKPAVIPELDAISKSEGLAPAYLTGGGTLWYWVGDRVRVTKATGRYQYADTASDRIGPDLKPGEEFDVDWITEYEGGLWYYTPYATRINAADVVRVSDMKGAVAA